MRHFQWKDWVIKDLLLKSNSSNLRTCDRRYASKGTQKAGMQWIHLKDTLSNITIYVFLN